MKKDQYLQFRLVCYAWLLIAVLLKLASFKLLSILPHSLAHYKDNIAMALTVHILIVLVVMSIEFIAYAMRFGLKNGTKLLMVKRQLLVHLLDNHIYQQTDESEWVHLPKIKFVKTNTPNEYDIYIRNSIDFDTKLTNLDISAGLIWYKQDGQPYYTHDHNYIVYHVYDSSIDYRYDFKSIDDMVAVFDNSERDFQIDKRLSFDFCHMLVSGKNGSGKSYLMYYLIMTYLYKYDKNNLYICDPKLSDLYKVGCTVLPKGHTANAKTAVAWFDRLQQLLDDRQTQYSVLSSGDVNKTYKDYGLSPVFVIVDEFASLKAFYKTDKKTYDKMYATLVQLILMGRQLGIFVCVATQKAGADTIPTEIRSNLIFKCLLGAGETTDYVTSFEIHSFKPEKCSVGQGYYVMARDGATVRKIEVPKMIFDVTKAIKSLV